MPALSNINAAAGVACAMGSSRAALTIADSSILKNSQNFFQMRFIETLSFALKYGCKKFFSEVAV